MHLSETRYIFWDGVVNVNPTTGAVDRTLACKQYYLEANPVARAANPDPLVINGLSRAESDAGRQRAIISNFVVPGIKVRIKKVDEWFIPSTDMLAIELRLRFMPRIKSLMLRVWDCDPDEPYKLLYQEILNDTEVTRLPTVDKSVGEAAAQKENRIQAHGQHEVKCLSHCYIEVWLSENPGAFDQCDANAHPVESNARPMTVHDKSLPPQNMPDVWSPGAFASLGGWISRIANRQPFSDADWQARRAHKEQKHADKLGKNIALAGCRLIEDIMDDRKALKIYDHEPSDRLGPEQPKAGLGVLPEPPGGPPPPPPPPPGGPPPPPPPPGGPPPPPPPPPGGPPPPPPPPGGPPPPPPPPGGPPPPGAPPGGPPPPPGAPPGGPPPPPGGPGAPGAPAGAPAAPPWPPAPGAPPPPGSPPPLPPSKKGDGVTVYPDFRRRIRLTLYQICQHTAIGFQLVRDVANTPNRGGKDTSIHIYPSTQVAKFIEGVGVDPDPKVGIRDDYDAYLLFNQAKDALQKGVPDPMPSSQNLRRPVNKNWLTVSAKRLANNHIGASDGRGCVGKFFFHPINMLKCDADVYHVQRHQNASSHQVNGWRDHQGNEVQRNVILAKKCEYKLRLGQGTPQETVSDVRISIETPLFLAFAHEMIHARRFQLGINAEHERIESVKVEDNHPDTLIAKLPSAELRKNLVSRYKKYNLEEYDTIEGRGVATSLSNLSQNACQNLIDRGVLPAGANAAGPHPLQATENLIRQELDLETRYRYVDEASDVIEVANSDAAPRLFVKPRTVKPTPPKMTSAKPTDIKTQLNYLHADVGLPQRAVELQPDVNYFQYADPQFGWCYFFAHTFDDANQQNHAESIFEEIRLRYVPRVYHDTHLLTEEIHIADSLSIVSPPLRTALEAFEAPLPVGAALKDHKLAAVRNLLAILIPSDISDDVQRMLRIAKLRESANANSNASGIEAFGTLKITADPNLDLLSDRAVYLPDHPYDNPKTLCHMLIHESLHMHSFRANGFMAWDMNAGSAIAGHLAPDEAAREEIKKTLNEGTTELFARIATYRLNCEYRAKGFDIVSAVDLFGGVPSYEYPTHLMCQVVRDLNAAGHNGVALLGRAYFEGEWANFNNAMSALAPATGRYTGAFFDKVALVGHQGANYFGNDSEGPVRAVTELKNTYGIDWDLPEDLVSSTQPSGPTYEDPVFCTGVSATDKAPLASRMDCDQTDTGAPFPLQNLETECYRCNELILIPPGTIRKT
jgi:hypothetical protein